MTQSYVIPKPSRPWRPSPREKGLNIGLLLASVVTSYALVALTEMKGKLAYFFVFFAALALFNMARGLITKDWMNGRDQFFSVIMLLGMTIVILPTASILYTVFDRGRKGLHAGLLTNDMALATPSDPITSGGLLHAIVGTFLLVAVALIVSLPIGILTALYLTEIKGRFTRPIRFLVQAMSGVPSIVAGLFILSSVVYTVTKSYSGLVGSLALTILMIPTIARTAEEVLNLIPNDLREAGVALGGTQWRTVAMVVIPAARSGLITALILGVARIVGETAPILLLTGGGDAVNINPTQGAMGSLPFYIWKSFLLGTEESITRGWAGLLVLLVLVLSLFLMARFLGSRRTK
ncbi:MAG: phosphate ABC transporter permease PstA [Candidatus Nanopelagicaceae bacterium]